MKRKIAFYAHSLEIGGIEKALIALLKNIDYKNNNVALYLENKNGV
ncbi:MAG: glycosyltransferase, partial [Tenericutes bacterium]|nr:glycosyltransferase [Mycoplasmatota bacterium]